MVSIYPVFPEQELLSAQLEPLPEGRFLLPVCVTSAELNDLLTASYKGRFWAEKQIETASGQEFETIRHMIPLLQAMAFVNAPHLTGCWDLPPSEGGSMIRWSNCGIEQYDPDEDSWDLIQQVLPLSAGPVCALTGTLHILPFNQALISARNSTGAQVEIMRMDTNNHIRIGSHPVTLIGTSVRLSPVGREVVHASSDVLGGGRYLSFFGEPQQSRQIITGASVSSALADLITKLDLIGIIEGVPEFPDIPQIAAIRASGCGLEYSYDGDNWQGVEGANNETGLFLPLRVDSGCNGISLQGVPLDIQRVGGSTEAANAMINLSAVGEAQLAPLPMAINFSAQTTDQLRPVANIDARLIEDNDAAYRSQLNLNVTDATQTRTVISARANNTHAALGFLGAQPVSRQTIAYGDMTQDQLILEIGQALHNFGLLNFVPCLPEFGDWAIEWRNAQLFEWPNISCGQFAFGGMTTVENCSGGNRGLGANLGWAQLNNSTLVRAEIDIAWNGIIPVTGFAVSLGINPGGSGSSVPMQEHRFTASGSETLEWDGDEEFSNIGIAAVIQSGGPGSVTVTRVKLEGYGEVPPQVGGLLCG